jgi:GntR family transcriptional repressor for pyruvate dehydrogenase complex
MTGANVRIPKASDIVVESLRRRIFAEKPAPGSRLTCEAELTSEFGLGRVTVREAVRMLERDGLVEVKRGPEGGIFVRYPDSRQLSEAFALLFTIEGTTLGEFADFRTQVEPHVARLAAEAATLEQRKEIREIARAEAAGESWADIHAAIAAACGNGVYSLVMQALHVSLETHFRHDRITRADRDDTHHAHTRLAEAIMQSNGAAAERIMRKHLQEYTAFMHSTGLAEEPIVPVR